MTRLARLFATGLVVISISAVTFADGGQTQGPNAVAPPPPTEYTMAPLDKIGSTPEQASSVDIATEVVFFATLLAEAII